MPGGGVRQRLGLGAEPLHDTGEDVEKQRSYASGGRKRARSTGGFLTSLYAIGRLSAPELQEGASCVGGHDALCEDLAASGNGGTLRGNVHRDVIRRLGRVKDSLPKVNATRISLWDPDLGKKILDTAHFLLPSEFFDLQVAKKHARLLDWLCRRWS